MENNAAISDFKAGLREAAPMPLTFRREKRSHDYFKVLGITLSNSLASGKSPLLPVNGYLDLKPVWDVSNNNTKFNVLTELMLQDMKGRFDNPSGAFITWEALCKAQEAGVACHIGRDKKSITIPEVEFDWSKMKSKKTYFNLCQIEGAEDLAAYYSAVNRGHFVPGNNSRIRPLNPATKEPFQYIAQVIDSIRNGYVLEVSDEQAEMFRTKMIGLLQAQYKPGCLDVEAIQKISLSAENVLKRKRSVQAVKPARKLVVKRKVAPSFSR